MSKKEVIDKVKNQIRDQVCCQIYNCIWEEVGKEVINRVSSEACEPMEPFWNKIRNRVENQVGFHITGNL